MYQKIVIVGTLGGDPEMRYTPSGTPVTNFSVATNRVWNDQQGEQHKETTWFRVKRSSSRRLRRCVTGESSRNAWHHKRFPKGR